ncbi:MAG: N-acetylmuramoyl-L-alanine amidase, partial [Oscillospiraceae bacterium]
PTQGSQSLAEQTQALLISSLNPGSKRACKPAESVYLMQHIRCTGILVECGFLSNREEEAALRTPEYQKKLCCVIASAADQFLTQEGDMV